MAAVTVVGAVAVAGYLVSPGARLLGYAGLVTAALAAVVFLLNWLSAVRMGWPLMVAVGAVGGVGDAAFVRYERGALPLLWWLLATAIGAALGALVGLPTRPPTPSIPVEIAGYRIEGVLGSGASGTVYRAFDRAGRRVAVKVLAADWLDDTEFRDRFRAEVAIMRSLDHPNCVRVYDVIDTADFAAIVTEYVEGATLKAVLAQAGRLPGVQAAKVMAGALRGLAHVHDRGMVHRDIKPANILVDSAGASRLLDYGLTRDFRTGMDPDDAVAGSPAYMSPEQIRGEPLDQRSDVYSCGVVLFELLTGRRPFVAAKANDVLAAHLRAPTPDPVAVQSDVPERVAGLIVAAMAKRAADRPQDAEEFRRELEDAAKRAYGPAWAAVPVTGLSLLGGLEIRAATGTGAGSTGHAVQGTGTAGPSAVARSQRRHVSRERLKDRFRPRQKTRFREAAAEPGFDMASRRDMATLLRVIGATAAAVTAIAVVITAVAVRKPKPHVRPLGLASCLVGTWTRQAGTYDDVWNNTPVRVRYPPTAHPAAIRYYPDGSYVYTSPAGEPPAVGVLHGAPFIDKSYGVQHGQWRVLDRHRVLETGTRDSNYTQILYAGYAHVSGTGTPLQTGSVPLTMACSSSTLELVDDFTYHGRRLISHQSYQRQRSVAITPQSLPGQHGLLGGVDFDGFCKFEGAAKALNTKPLTGAGAATHNWFCAGGARRPVSMPEACQWAYPAAQDVVARALDPNSAISWLCYGGPPPTFTITPRQGGVGTVIIVTSVSPCPRSAQAVQVELVQAPAQDGIQTGGRFPLLHGGRWQYRLTVGPFGGHVATIPPGTAQLTAFCLLPHRLYSRYRPQPFHFTGHT